MCLITALPISEPEYLVGFSSDFLMNGISESSGVGA